MSGRRRAKPRLPRELRRAFRDYLRHGGEAAGAVAVIARHAEARDRRQQAARDGG